MAWVLIAFVQLICEVDLDILIVRVRERVFNRDETQLADDLLFELSVVIS